MARLRKQPGVGQSRHISSSPQGKIRGAARAKGSSNDEVVGKVADYIRSMASRRDGDTNHVPRPSRQEWRQLSSGEDPQLPSPEQVGIHSGRFRRGNEDPLAAVFRAGRRRAPGQ